MRLGIVSSVVGFCAGILIAAAATGVLPLSSARADVEPAMMIGVDIPGGDFLNFALNIPDPGLCRQECHRYTQCAAWTFVKPGVQGQQAVCWLKTAAAAAQGVPNDAAISGIKQSGWTPAPGSAAVTGDMALGLDLPGSDIASFALSNADPDQCRKACNARGDCRAWTFVKPGVQGQQAMCWLKGSVPSSGGRNPNVISGRGGGGGVVGGVVGGVTGGVAGSGEWGVWAYRGYGSDWGDPCSIQYAGAQIAGNRYDADVNYRRVRTRPSQREADLDIDHFGRFHRNQPDDVVKMTPCDPDGNDNDGNNNNTGGSHPQWMSGSFDSDFGVVTLSPGGGTYTYHDGTITVSKIDGDVMEGIWRQSGTGSCPGNTVWGHFRFTFTESGFSGIWGHCDAEPSRGWSGTRK